MKTRLTALPVALALLYGCSATTPSSTVQPEATPPEPLTANPSPFQAGVRLEAGGEPINVTTGHAVPCAVDWNGDGKKDLLVGQFSGGRIRLYLNRGSDVSPEFDDFVYLSSAGEEIKLPAG